MAFGILEGVLLLVTILVALKLFVFTGNKPAAPNMSTAQKDQKVIAKEVNTVKKPPMKIFFGSQSGTAETFASEFMEEAVSYGFDATVVDLEDYEPESLGEEKTCVFFMATFGEGEPTDNAVKFWEWIKNPERLTEHAELCENLDFAMFALGNRQYEKFCNVGREIDELLYQMKGTRITPHGEGDDDGTMDEDYAAWKERFWEAARSKYGLKEMQEKKFRTQVGCRRCGYRGCPYGWKALQIRTRCSSRPQIFQCICNSKMQPGIAPKRGG